MSDNYAKIVQDNLEKLYASLPKNLAEILPADQEGGQFVFDAFGQTCQLRPDGIFLDGEKQTGVLGILISLYARHVQPEPCILEPLKSFKDFPNSMPYAGAFTTHTEQILIPYVEKIEKAQDQIMEQLRGQKSPENVGGDFSYVVRPLPKMALCYIFYKADEEFPASVTCLYSGNAQAFMPIDGMADVGEYTSRKILNILGILS